jgi:hypothetical protein
MLDKINQNILDQRIKAFNEKEGPRVGDFILMLDGSMERFSHDWGDSIQTTDGKFGSSFYLDSHGYAAFSGGLNPSIPKRKIVDLHATQEGGFWFFSHNIMKAHNGINVTIPCRIFQQII